ncbi:Redoxin domain protein [Sesbania bispinosa]|nr:Redoxin domain protein [Sesbania bispinosa]
MGGERGSSRQTMERRAGERRMCTSCLRKPTQSESFNIDDREATNSDVGVVEPVHDDELRGDIPGGLLASLHGRRASTANDVSEWNGCSQLQRWFCKVAHSFRLLTASGGGLEL